MFLDGEPVADRSSRCLVGTNLDDSLPMTIPFLGFVVREGDGGGIDGFDDLL
jgi:hypothetical protein